jgi:ubiquinone/menaquinone biosynthesis C-methylase UbiE
MDFSSEDRILDFGCGLGRLSTWIAEFGVSEVVGLDSSADMIKEAERRCLPKKNLRFLNYDSEIPFTSGYFDKVLSVWVLQHILNGNFRAVIQELGRVLKPNGRIFLIEHVARRTTLEKYPGMNVCYKILRSPEEYIRTFEGEGFRLVKYYAISARGGPFYKFIVRNLFPAFMKPLLHPLVKFDIFWTKGKGIPEQGYVDCLFVFEKVVEV